MQLGDYFKMYEGVYEFESISQIESNTPINAIIKIRPDLYTILNTDFNKKGFDIEQKIPILKNKSEKLLLISGEIAKIQHEMKSVYWTSFYNLLSLKWNDAHKQATLIGSQSHLVKIDIEEKKDTGIFGLTDTFPTAEQNEINADLIKRLDKLFLSCKIYVANESGIIEEKIKQTLYKFSIHWHLQRQFLIKLCNIHTELENDTYLKLQVPDEVETSKSNIIEVEQEEKNKAFTLARQNLVIHYLLKHSGISSYIDKTNIARIIQLLTGREGNKKAEDTRVYRFVKSPFLSDKNLKRDLQFIRPYFENLGMQAIIDDINKEINSLP